jgi:FKBP-type peptidyl-prolyl cis-trans isomerase
MTGAKDLLKNGITTLSVVALLSLASCGEKKGETDEAATESAEEVVEEVATAETGAPAEIAADEISQEDYLAAQSDYLAANAAREGVMVTESGLQYRILQSSGSQEHPTADDRVVVHYHGTFIDGEVFDSTKGGSPADFPLNRVIQGWTEGLQLMGVGDTFEFTIPAELGYGPEGYPGAIPGGATLIFEVELLAIL